MRQLVAVAMVLCLMPAPAVAAPDWLTDTTYDDLGRGDRVPAPWTPVQARGQVLSTWGRTLRWTGASLLPTSVTSGGHELLAGPMRVDLAVEGQTTSVPLHRFQVNTRSRSRVSFRATGTAAGISFTLDGWLEYDGFAWSTLAATAPPGRIVEALRVHVPLRTGCARLYQAFSRTLAGALGDRPIDFPWMADAANGVVDFYHWFGTEDLGLGFTYSTLEHWAPATEDRIATFTPGPRTSVYTVHLIEQPVPIAGRSFCFGLQATPIKPLPPDYGGMLAATYYREAWRASEQLRPNMDMMLIWPAETGIMPGLNDPCGLDATRMAEVVNEAHAAGLPMLTIAACPQKISHTVPELADYRALWQTLPESVLDWEGHPQLQNCGKPETLRRWLFHGWAIQNVRRFGTDGVYFDGWQAGSIACSNPAHGCGWADTQGVRHLTVPVLEGREFNQRMLLFLQDEQARRQQQSPGAPPRPLHYWIHSWEFVPSVMGFATEWLTGEFAGWPLSGPSMLTPEGTYGKCLGLDLFRARCLSTNWGVPNLFDALMWEADRDCPTDAQTRMAYAWFLPQGVSPAMIHYMNHQTVVAVTRALTDFGIRHSRFTPGWRPSPFWRLVRPAPREVMVATWDRGPTSPVLTVVSNLRVDAREHVTLEWTGPGRPSLHNALTGEQLAHRHGRLTLHLAPESFILILAE